MALSEFDIIARYFAQPGLAADPARHPGVVLGIGDDAALIRVAPEDELALSIDTLVEGVHFPAGASPARLGHRALAVNLSDLAAMGATPLGFTLALTLPHADADWIEAFASGLMRSAQRYGCPLLGGNLTRGPLQISIQVHGTVPRGCALRRGGARPGDLLYVSGQLGAAALALRLLQGSLVPGSPDEEAALLDAYYDPVPRLALGRALLGRASAALDVSDGLLADLGHLLKASGVGARLHASRIPVAAPLHAHLDAGAALQLAVSGGDDYELVFALPPSCRSEVDMLQESGRITIACIGEVIAGEGLELLDANGSAMHLGLRGFDHFSIAGAATDD